MTIIVITTFIGCCGIFHSWYILSLLLRFELENLQNFFYWTRKCFIVLYSMEKKACLLIVKHDELMFSDYSCLY